LDKAEGPSLAPADAFCMVAEGMVAEDAAGSTGTNITFCSLFGCPVLVFHPLVKVSGSAFWDGQALPFFVTDHFSDIDDLPDVMRVMGQLPVDGVDGDEWFVPDIYGF
jgi:hypothetical protein